MSLKIPRFTYCPLRLRAIPRSVASFVCFNRSRNCVRLDFPDEFVPNNAVNLPNARSALAQDLKFSKCSVLSIERNVPAQELYSRGMTLPRLRKLIASSMTPKGKAGQEENLPPRSSRLTSRGDGYAAAAVGTASPITRP